MPVQWFNPETGRYEVITEATPKAVESLEPTATGRTSAKASMEQALAFRSGKAPEHNLKQMAATAAPRAESPAVASMRKMLPKVSQAEGGTGRAGSSTAATSSMRAQLERMGIPTIGGDA